MNIYQELVIPDDKRVFFVGDIHGAFDLYKKGCKDLGITDEDVVVSLGDLIDRGPKNLATVVEFTRKENRYAIQGNHEDMMIKGMLQGSREYFECWFMNGGSQTWEEVGDEAGSLMLAEMVKDLPILLEVKHQGKTFGCVHGGIPRFRTGSGNWSFVVAKAFSSSEYTNALIWDRSTIESIKFNERLGIDIDHGISPIDDIDYVLHGHSPVKTPIIAGNRVYMDTGGIFNGKLTFAYPEEGELKFYTTGDYDEL